MILRVVTPPAALLTAAEAKVAAPVFAGDAEARLTALLGAAQAAIEPPNGWVGLAFGVQTLEACFEGFPCFEMPLPCPPLRAVASVNYRDRDGAEQTLAPETYEPFGVGFARGGLIPRPDTTWPATARRADAVRITFEAGHAPDDPQLLPVRQAIILAATELRQLGTRELGLSSRSVEGVGTHSWVVSDAAGKVIRAAVESLLMPMRVYA